MEGYKPKENNNEAGLGDVAGLRGFLGAENISPDDHDAVLNAAAEYFGEGYTSESISAIVEQFYADEQQTADEADTLN